MIDWETSLLFHAKKNFHFRVNFFSINVFIFDAIFNRK